MNELLHQNLRSPIENFYHWEKERPHALFLRQPYGKNWHTLTYSQAGDEARKIASVLLDLGLKKGDHVGILSKNCYHWILADLAIMMAGMVSVPFYASLPADQLKDVIDRSDIKVLFVGKLDSWEGKEQSISSAVKVIRFPHYKGNAQVTIGKDWNQLRDRVKPLSDCHIPNLNEHWTILFTSGTTGSPKGVVHIHKSPALIIRGEELTHFIGIFKQKNPQYFSFLPLNHVGERIGVEISCLATGGCMSFGESLETFPRNLQETQPTSFFAVPRIWTKFYQGVAQKMSPRKLEILLNTPLISIAIRRKLLTALGLSKAQIVATGAAITPIHLKKWFGNLGIHMIEAYGMTEVCGSIANGVSKSTPADSVGQIVPFCEVKIEPETGEILMKSPHVMKEYYKDPESTASILRDGWIYSGDRGSLDAKGNLRILGRVKDAFKTEKGLFIIPGPIEDLLSVSEHIEVVCLVGIAIPQPIALVNLCEKSRTLSKNQVKESLEKLLGNINAPLPNYQKVSTIIVTETLWNEANGFLTPTMKVKRARIDDHYNRKYEHWHQHPDAVIWES